MKLEKYLEIYGKKMGYLESLFLRDIYYQDLGEKALDFIEPEVNIPRNDGTDKNWRIDFVVITETQRYAIECNGFNYHAPGMVSKERFDELQNKSNEIVRQGYIFINLSRDQIQNNTQDAIYQLRRSFIGDPQLYSIFLNRNSGKVTPHEVQQEALEALNDSRDIGASKGLVVLATGLGKTYLSIFDVLQVEASTILYIVHVGEVLKDARNSFEKVLSNRITDMGMYQSNSKEKHKKILFATIQTLTKEKNLSTFSPDQFDYIILDETHHLAAPTYKKVFKYFTPKFFLGLTATPERLDEKEILPFYDNNLVYRMDQIEAIKQGFLTNINYFGYKDNVDYTGIKYNGFKYDIGDLNKLLMIQNRDEAIINKYIEKANGKKTIAFCVSTEHADWCSKVFNENGIPSIAIHSKLDSGKSELNFGNVTERIKDFKNDKYKVAFVVNMFNEGVDFPEVECILLLRPTESITILTQQIGRGLRIAPGKRNVVVLDFIGNYQTAHKILPTLGIHSTSELKYDKEKNIYYYDNDGRRVEFEQEVVEIFRMMLSKSTKEINEELISTEWQEYGSYLENTTKSGNKLYWKVGNKNDHLGIHIWAIRELENLVTSMTATELSLHIRNESQKLFPGKTLEGTRALFLSKLLGFLKDTNPLESTQAFKSLESLPESEWGNVFTNQLEKLYFWNDIYSLTDRHTKKEKRTPINKFFNIYPIFFLYQVILSLNDDYGYDTYHITKFEFDYFLSLARSDDELESVVERIIKFRDEDERYELRKYLKKMSKMDARFYKVMRYSKYFKFSPTRIELKDDLLPQLRERIKEYKVIRDSGNLIQFDEKNPIEYRKLLYSTTDLIAYHINR